MLADGTVLVATSSMGLFAGSQEPPQSGPGPPAYPGLRMRRTGAGFTALWVLLALVSAATLPLAVWLGP